jgi:hypothetical protein
MNQRKHISSTHNERYYHVYAIGPASDRATVFFRQLQPRVGEDGAPADPDWGWYASVALCDYRDQFVKQVGRNVARRKFFSRPDTGPGGRIVVDGAPSYDKAKGLALEAAARRRV